MVSAQRFYSISIGQKDNRLLNEYFNTSLSLHIIIGILVAFVFLLLKPWLFSGFLNISEEKISIAKTVYDLMVLSSVITVVGVPFSAIINAHEDMTLLAISSIVSNLVKLGAAIVLLFISSNLLLVYTVITLLSVLVKLLIELGWSYHRYDSSRLRFNLLLNTKHYKQMIGFIGWNTLGTAGVLVRNQGVAVVLNIFFGTVINTVYGIANQVNSLVLSFASTITTIFTPSIIQAKGEGNHKRMMDVAILSSKLSFFISSLMSIPILGFTKEILDVWLTNYPEKTEAFCKFIILSFLVSQLYPGIHRAILAEGKIKWYEVFTFIYFVIIIPIAVFLFKMDYSAESIMILMVLSQVALLFLTIRYAKKYCGLSPTIFLIKSVIYPIAICCLIQVSLYLGRALFNSVYLQVGILFLCLVGYTFLFWIIVLNRFEKETFRKLLKSLIR